jgi:hypothetical protein
MKPPMSLLAYNNTDDLAPGSGSCSEYAPMTEINRGTGRKTHHPCFSLKVEGINFLYQPGPAVSSIHCHSPAHLNYSRDSL